MTLSTKTPNIMLAILALLFTGCVTNFKSPPVKYAYPHTAPKEEISIFKYDKSPLDEDLTPAWAQGLQTHEIYNLSFASVNKTETVKAEYWKNKTSGKKKLIIILPIIDSVRFVGEHYTHVMASWGGNTDFNILLIEDTKKISYLEELKNSQSENEFLNWMKLAAISIKNYVVDARRLIDWAENQPEIDSQKIGIIGGSISATMAALIMAAEPRINAGIFDKGGGSWHELFSDSEQSQTKKARITVLKNFGWSQKKFGEKIKPILLPVSPISWAGRINPEKILFISARDETWFTKSSTESFWNALGKPERFEYNAEHKRAFLLSLTIFGGHYADFRIFNHFKKNLK